MINKKTLIKREIENGKILKIRRKGKAKVWEGKKS